MDSAAELARWLAEVAQALDDADLLMRRIAADRVRSADALALRHRIQGAKRATRTLQLASERRSERKFPPV